MSRFLASMRSYQCLLAKFQSFLPPLFLEKIDSRYLLFVWSPHLVDHVMLYTVIFDMGFSMQVIKEELERGYRNTNMKPIKHSTYLRLKTLRKRFWDVDDKLACLLTLSVADVAEHIPRLFNETYIEALCHGNLYEEEAVGTANIFKQALVKTAMPAESRPVERIVKLDPGSALLYTANVKNEAEENSVVEVRLACLLAWCDFHGFFWNRASDPFVDCLHRCIFNWRKIWARTRCESGAFWTFLSIWFTSPASISLELRNSWDTESTVVYESHSRFLASLLPCNPQNIVLYTLNSASTHSWPLCRRSW